MQQAVATAPEPPLLELLNDALLRRLSRNGSTQIRIDPDADLIERGMIDSQGLLDIILDVEAGSGRMFDADGINLEQGVTLRRLAAAFSAPI